MAQGYSSRNIQVVVFRVTTNMEEVEPSLQSVVQAMKSMEARLLLQSRWSDGVTGSTMESMEAHLSVGTERLMTLQERGNSLLDRLIASTELRAARVPWQPNEGPSSR